MGIVSARAILTFGIAEGDEDFRPLSVTSREMLQVERTVKGFATVEFLQQVTIEGLYRTAWVVLRMRGDVDMAVKFDEFIDAWSVSLADPRAALRRKALAVKLANEGVSPDQIAAQIMAADLDRDQGDEGDTYGGGDAADPTQTTA